MTRLFLFYLRLATLVCICFIEDHCISVGLGVY